MKLLKPILYALTFLLIYDVAYAQKRPNIVIIISDDHAYQTISAYGSTSGHTPQIDRIADGGAIFNRAYVVNSICGPSRAALLTGKYSHKNGFRDNETSNFDHGQDSFIKQLTKNGYKTAWIGKIHLGHKLEGFTDFDILVDQGHYFNPDFINPKGTARTHGYVSDIVTDKALTWLDTHQDEPFCIVIGHKATHRTWMPDPRDFGKNDDKEFVLPPTFYDDYEGRPAAAQQEMSIDKDMRMGYDLKMFESIEKMKQDGNFKRMTDEQLQAYIDYYRPIYEELQRKNLSGKELAEWKFRRYMIDYLNTAESMDRNIGKVLDYLEENNLEENTLVVYLSDQGFYMGEHGWFDKRWMYEESFRTPMVAKLPGIIKPHSVIDGIVMNVDMAPTFLELAGVAVPADMQGTSIVPLLSGKKKNVQKSAYYHYYENGEHAVSPHFGVSDGRYKLIRFYKRVEGWEFFDLKKDPSELKNLYHEAKYKKQIAKMKKVLKDKATILEDTEALELLQR
jgi:arylsulfatase A-like enzyme